MRKVLNIGSMNYDYVYRVRHILTASETLGAEAMDVFCGGKGLNQSVALARAGIQVYHAGSVGEEGDELLAFLQKEGVDTGHCRILDGKSGHTIIQVDEDGQNCILVFGGANKRQDRGHIQTVLDSFQEGDLVVLQNELNDPAYLLEEVAKRKLTVILNPSPINEELMNLNLSGVHYFLINEVEGFALTGFSEPEDILRGMKERYPMATVVLTLGEKGAYAMEAGKSQASFQPAFPVKVVDTTAAGDTFLGYFVAGLLNELSMQDCLRQAARAAAIAVTRAGAAPSIPRKDELN